MVTTNKSEILMKWETKIPQWILGKEPNTKLLSNHILQLKTTNNISCFNITVTELKFHFHLHNGFQSALLNKISKSYSQLLGIDWKLC